MTQRKREYHGRTRSPEYRVWERMHGRCTNANNGLFHRYGARGVTVCARWKSFSAFLSDMGPRPSTEHSIDRIDNNGPYSPDNCRWVPRSVQDLNTSRTLRLGDLRGADAIAAEFGVSRRTFYRKYRHIAETGNAKE